MDLSRGDSLPMFVCSCISIVASLSILMTFSLFPQLHRKSSKEILFYLVSSNCISALGSMVGEPSNDSAACWFQGLVTNLFTLSSVLWTVIVCFTIYSIVVMGKCVDSSHDWKEYHVLCWGVPLFATLLPLINTTYGRRENSAWCWLVPTARTPTWGLMFWEWISFYAIIWMSVIAMTVFVIGVMLNMKYVRAESKHSVLHALQKLRWYPAVIVASWLVTSIVDTLLNSSLGFMVSPAAKHLRSASNVIPCLQGLFTGLVFWISNDDVRHHLHVLVTTGKYPDIPVPARHPQVEDTFNHKFAQDFSMSIAHSQVQVASALRQSITGLSTVMTTVGDNSVSVHNLADMYALANKLQTQIQLTRSGKITEHGEGGTTESQNNSPRSGRSGRSSISLSVSAQVNNMFSRTSPFYMSFGGMASGGHSRVHSSFDQSILELPELSDQALEFPQSCEAIPEHANDYGAGAGADATSGPGSPVTLKSLLSGNNNLTEISTQGMTFSEQEEHRLRLHHMQNLSPNIFMSNSNNSPHGNNTTPSSLSAQYAATNTTPQTTPNNSASNTTALFALSLRPANQRRGSLYASAQEAKTPGHSYHHSLQPVLSMSVIQGGNDLDTNDPCLLEDIV